MWLFISQDVPKDFDIKSKIEEILQTLEADKLRARTMDIDDFMKVLHAFNSAGIHFS
jgi:18S rRNA (adenine1779-N6/adenine1780-N6)-dimethyltransferase